MKQVIHIPAKYETMPIEDLVPYDKNPRKHSQRSQDELKRAMKKDGFIVPIVIDQHNRIIAGHGRRLAALDLKMPKIPYNQVHVEEAEYIRLVISDNKVAELSKWDNKLLAEVAEILDGLVDDNLEIAGFNDEELDKIFGHSYKETLENVADFGDSGDVDVMDESTRVTSMTFKMTVKHHKSIKSVLGAIMRENNFEDIGEALIFMTSKFKGETRTIRRKA